MAYKIYVKSNYFYIVDTDTETIYEGLAKDVRVRKQFVESEDFYFDNVNGFTSMVNIEDIQDEQGNTYADLATFVAFYEANTGNFNTPQEGGDFIPLAGTTIEKPITGNLNFDFDSDTGSIYDSENLTFGLKFLDNVIMFYNDKANNILNYLSVQNNSIFIHSEGNPDFYGIKCDVDFSQNQIEDKLIVAQRSYVDAKIPDAPTTGAFILKCIDGVYQWVSE